MKWLTLAVVVSALLIDVYVTGAIAGFILAAKNDKTALKGKEKECKDWYIRNSSPMTNHPADWSWKK